MIISHKHKFIFLKTNKTAGTSIEIALSRFCGENDIITPISPKDEEIRTEPGYRGAQNYQVPFSRYSLKDWVKFAIRAERQTYYNHMSSGLARRFVGEDIWNNYFKFCFARNPWDLVISKYYWHYKTKPRPPISEFIDSYAVENLKLRGIGIYTINGKVAVDRICRYENLEADLTKGPRQN